MPRRLLPTPAAPVPATVAAGAQVLPPRFGYAATALKLRPFRSGRRSRPKPLVGVEAGLGDLSRDEQCHGRDGDGRAGTHRAEQGTADQAAMTTRAPVTSTALFNTRGCTT